MFRTDDMYGDFPTIEEIKRDYQEFIELVGTVTTLEQAKVWNQKDKFSIEANGSFLEDYILNGGTDKKLEWLRYEAFGCLAYIYVRLKKGIVSQIIFDVWSNKYDAEFITDITINDLTEENYQLWINNCDRR